MAQNPLETALEGLPLGAVRYFDRTGSTNDEALAWAAQAPPDFSLVVANEQIRGKGRSGRWWHTPPDAALAFSLILSLAAPPGGDLTPRLTALGALAVIDGLQSLTGLTGQIKWPNDVLLAGRKAAGVLVEASWLGEVPQSFIVGIGINVRPEAVPSPERLAFPATSVETVLGAPVDRWALLRAILEAFYSRRPTLSSTRFLADWEAHLAYRGASVRVSNSGVRAFEGVLLGLAQQGQLVVRGPDGVHRRFAAGEIRLRPGREPDAEDA